MSRNSAKWKFHAHPLMTNCHLQTVLGICWPRRYAPSQAVKHFVPVDDGDQIVLHEDAPATADGSLPMVLLIHGLGGCHRSTYVLRTVEKLAERGYHYFRMDMRGCGTGDVVSRMPTHCGQWQDVAAALSRIAELYPDRDTQIVGFSMGGSLTLNMLAEAGHESVGNLKRSLIISPPIDLMQNERSFRTGMGRCYDKFFVRLLWKQNLGRWTLNPDMAPGELPELPRRMRELDEMVTVPEGGFRSVNDYYLRCSPGPKLAAIRQPVTIFSSEDDPIVPIGPLLRNPLSSSIELLTTTRGGHLGFLASRNGDPDFRWLDWRILDWLEQSKPRASGIKRHALRSQTRSV